MYAFSSFRTPEEINWTIRWHCVFHRCVSWTYSEVTSISDRFCHKAPSVSSYHGNFPWISTNLSEGITWFLFSEPFCILITQWPYRVPRQLFAPDAFEGGFAVSFDAFGYLPLKTILSCLVVLCSICQYLWSLRRNTISAFRRRLFVSIDFLCLSVSLY